MGVPTAAGSITARSKALNWPTAEASSFTAATQLQPLHFLTNVRSHKYMLWLALNSQKRSESFCVKLACLLPAAGLRHLAVKPLSLEIDSRQLIVHNISRAIAFFLSGAITHPKAKQ